MKTFLMVSLGMLVACGGGEDEAAPAAPAAGPAAAPAAPADMGDAAEMAGDMAEMAGDMAEAAADAAEEMADGLEAAAAELEKELDAAMDEAAAELGAAMEELAQPLRDSASKHCRNRARGTVHSGCAFFFGHCRYDYRVDLGTVPSWRLFSKAQRCGRPVRLALNIDDFSVETFRRHHSEGVLPSRHRSRSGNRTDDLSIEVDL